MPTKRDPIAQRHQTYEDYVWSCWYNDAISWRDLDKQQKAIVMKRLTGETTEGVENKDKGK
jgi:hypothetical protein